MFQGLAIAAVLGFGLASLSLATDGFRAITTEGARRLSVEREARPVPVVKFTDHMGRSFTWSDLGPHAILVEFIFTTCPDVCQKMSSDFAGLLRASPPDSGDSIRFLSISFDPSNDTVEQLRRVASHFGADGERWRFARVDDPAELATLLDTFGIVVVPSPVRGYEHNAAIHGVDAEGRLARIVDISETREIFRWAMNERR